MKKNLQEPFKHACMAMKEESNMKMMNMKEESNMKMMNKGYPTYSRQRTT